MLLMNERNIMLAGGISSCSEAHVSTQGTAAVKRISYHSQSPDTEQYQCRNIKGKINN